MKIDVNEIIGPEANFTFTASASDFTFSPDELILKEEVKVFVYLRKIDKEIFLKGDIQTLIELRCSRCLESYEYPVNDHFEISLEPYSEYLTEEETELRKDELDFDLYKEDIIDLTELVREQILLAAPMIPLCHKECKGLCQQCGENLNHKKCSCTTEQIDPRWSKLKNLLN